MLGSGIYVRLRFQRTADSHITWNSTPEWIACASIKSGEKTSSNHSVCLPYADCPPYSRRDVSATMDARAFPRTGKL